MMEEHIHSSKGVKKLLSKMFNEFFIKLDPKHTNEEERIILFVGCIVNNNIKSYISAIKDVLQDDGSSMVVSEKKYL